MITSQFEMARVCSLRHMLTIALLALLPVSLRADEARPSETKSSEAEVKSADKTYPQGLVALSTRPEFSPYMFVVDKKRRFLRVYENKNGWPEMLLETPSDMGKNDGDKKKENDHKTPVGIYFLLERLTQPTIPFDLYGNLAFTTDYPNIFDKRDAKTGSGIWLHAVPDKVPLTRGSRGCVVVRNNVIRDLEKYVRLNQTPIIIFEDLKELSKDEYGKQRSQFLNFIETWRTAWQDNDVDTYMKFYDPTFKNAEMNYHQWYRHKKKLKGLYKTINVELSEPLIIHNRDQVVIRMLQQYSSDKHSDFGEKTIHAHYSPENGFRIIREDWKRVLPPADWPRIGNKKAMTSSNTTTTTATSNAAPQN